MSIFDQNGPQNFKPMVSPVRFPRRWRGLKEFVFTIWWKKRSEDTVLPFKKTPKAKIRVCSQWDPAQFFVSIFPFLKFILMRSFTRMRSVMVSRESDFLKDEAKQQKYNLQLCSSNNLPCFLHHLTRNGLVKDGEHSSDARWPQLRSCWPFPPEMSLPSRHCMCLLGTVSIFIQSCILTKHVRTVAEAWPHPWQEFIK